MEDFHANTSPKWIFETPNSTKYLLFNNNDDTSFSVANPELMIPVIFARKCGIIFWQNISSKVSS